jgi:hypothetical protein
MGRERETAIIMLKALGATIQNPAAAVTKYTAFMHP